MSSLKSNDIATSLGSTKQNTLDKGHQNGDVEMFGGKDHVISFDGQQNEEAVLQRTTCVAQQIEGDQASNLSSQDCLSTVLSTSSPQNGSGDRSNDTMRSYNETDKLEDAEEHAVPLQSEGGVDTLDKYAFNLDRDAYSHRVPHHLTTGMLVNVSKLDCRTSVTQHRDEAQKNGLSDVCPPLVPHEHELQERGLKTLQCIWVGMLPSQERTDQNNTIQPQASDDANGAGSSKKPPRKKARPSASIADLNEDDMKIIPFDPNALRVVVKKSDKPRKSWCLYALLNPNQDSLCQGFRVPFERVYFFRQFRDDEAKGFQARQFAIRAKVKAQAFPATPAPDVEQSLATSAVQAFKIPNTETTKARHTLAKDKPDGAPSMTGDVILDRMRNEISRAKQGSEIAGQANVRNSLQSYDRSLSSDSTLEDLHAELENDGLNDLDLDFEDYGSAACVGRAGGEEAYPEHAVAATDANYIEYENEMIGRFLRANSKTALDGSGNQHSKKGKDKISALETNNDQVVSNRNEAIQLSSPSSLCSRGYAVVDEHEPGSQMESQAVVLARRMVDAAIELAAQGDVAVLRQGCRMLDCLKNRGAPPKTGALGLYLNVPTDGTSDASDCAPMFDELLVRILSPFPFPLSPSRA